MPNLFIGVVSHERTRFLTSQGPDGLAARLSAALEEIGLSSNVYIETADLLDPATMRVDEATVQASLSAQLSIAREWDVYVAGGRPGWRPTLDHALRWGRRQLRRVRPPSVSTITRLVNIELAHIDLLERGVRSGAPWVLVLEDDAESVDIVDCAAGIAGLLATPGEQPVFVNVSESFAPTRLGVHALLQPLPDVQWQGRAHRLVEAADRPVTNTVCAVLYRSTFAADLLEGYSAVPLEPVLPIDWKLNRVILSMVHAGRLGSGDCWFVTPGPIDQLSMAPAPQG